MCRARPFSRSSSQGSRSGRRARVGPGEASGQGCAAPPVAACGERVQFLPAGPSPVGRKPLARRRGRCAAGGVTGSSTSPAYGVSEPSPGPGDRPALSSPPPGFSGRTRLPGSSGGQGPGAPAGTGPQIPPGTGPSVRVACSAGAASRSGRPSGSPSWGDAAAGGAVGRGHGAASASGSAGRPVCSPRAGGHQARRLGRLPAERRGGPETRTWGQLHARRFFDPCLWYKEPRFPTLGRRKVLYKCFVEGVLSLAKIRRLVI